MPLRTTIIATAVLAAAPLTAATDSAAGAPAPQAALGQCGWAMLHHAGNGWYAPTPTVWEASSVACNHKLGDPYRDPMLGDHAASIKSLQRAIRACYHSNLAVDGRYGPKTRAAVIGVQRFHRITADGVYGPQTRSAMRWRLYNPRLKVWSERCYSPF
jgi:Putative peptidoglycan binding domain